MRGKAGFTAIELAVVIVVIAIFSIMAAVGINSALKGIQLNNAADKLAADLRYAQTMASGTAVWYGANFEVSPVNQYTIYTTNGTTDTTAENPAKLGSSFIVNTNSDFGTVISGVDIAGGSKVEFSPRGTPYNDKTGSAVSAEAVITLNLDSSTKSVRITPNTGRIYIQ